MTDRSGIEIDYCPQCRGVWLDRGELDKLIERSNQEFSAPAAVKTSAPIPSQQYFEPKESPAQFEGPNYRDTDHSYNGQSGYSSHGNPHHKKRKKESFLSDMFDF
jgi:hypothetical protein